MFPAAGDRSGFRRPVRVVHYDAGAGAHDLFYTTLIGQFSAENQDFKTAENAFILCGKRAHDAYRHGCRIDLPFFQMHFQTMGIKQRFFRGEHERAAVQQADPELYNGKIKSKCPSVKHSLAGAESGHAP